MLTRRSWIAVLLAPALAGAEKTTVRGRLKNAGLLEAPGGGLVKVEGDASTTAVLADARLFGAEMMLTGEMTAPVVLRVDPIHTKAIHVHKDGKELLISYWCEVCSIRTYAPGKCMCCQEETELDLKESFDP
jgi:hypothetical protein